MPRSITPVLLFTAFMAFGTPTTAEAQLGGLIKKKVTEAVKRPEKPDEKKPATSEASKDAGKTDVFNENLLEITAPVFANVIRGLEAEIRLQDEFKRELSKYPTAEQYRQCMGKVAQSPEYMKLMMAEIPEKLSADEAQRLMQKRQADLEAAVTKYCPVKPVDEIWPNGRRREKLDSIHVKAAEAGDMTDIQVGYLIERIDRLCDFNAGDVGETADTLHKRDTTAKTPLVGGKLMIPGSGDKIYWVFTAQETNTLSAPNCRRFKGLTKRIMHEG